jgi:hypothetical protein
LTLVSACCLIAASCAATAPVEAVSAADAAEQAATVASTQVEAAVDAAATQISAAMASATGGTGKNSLPTPPGATLIQTPDSYILIQNGQATVINKSQIYGYTGTGNGK